MLVKIEAQQRYETAVSGSITLRNRSSWMDVEWKQDGVMNFGVEAFAVLETTVSDPQTGKVI